MKSAEFAEVAREFTYRGRSFPLLSRGEGPTVLVMYELFGVASEVLRFAAKLADRGFTATVPVLFGRHDESLAKIVGAKTSRKSRGRHVPDRQLRTCYNHGTVDCRRGLHSTRAAPPSCREPEASCIFPRLEAPTGKRVKDGVPVIGFRFTGDRTCSPERFDALEQLVRQGISWMSDPIARVRARYQLAGAFRVVGAVDEPLRRHVCESPA